MATDFDGEGVFRPWTQEQLRQMLGGLGDILLPLAQGHLFRATIAREPILGADGGLLKGDWEIRIEVKALPELSTQGSVRDKLAQLQKLELTGEDEEDRGHRTADNLLLDALELAGYPEFREAFHAIRKWYA